MADLTFDSLDAVPEDLRSDAKEVDGKVVISVVPKTKLTEFRDNNIRLAKERDQLTEMANQYKGIVGEDLSEFQKNLQELQTTAKRVKDGELVASTSLEAALESRTKELKADLMGKLEAIQKDRDAWKTKASQLDNEFANSIIDRHITDAVLDTKSGARTDALADILQRARSVYQVSDDRKNLIPKERQADGTFQVIYGPDGATPMAPAQWLQKLREEAPYFFQGSSGGGASGSSSAPSGGFSQKDIANMDMTTYTRLRKEGKIK